VGGGLNTPTPPRYATAGECLFELELLGGIKHTYCILHNMCITTSDLLISLT